MSTITLFLVSTAVAAPPIPEDHPLSQVAMQLSAIAKELQPDATLAQDNGSVSLSYKTRPFMVHAASKTGEVAEKAREVVGPSYEGLIVRVRLHEGRYAGAAKLPSNGARPYWRTFANAYPIARGKQYLHLNISYGSRTDEKLIKRVKEFLASVVDEDPDAKAGNTRALRALPPVMEIVLIDDKVRFRRTKDISFDLIIRNISDKKIDAEEAMWGLTVAWDGKEYPPQPDAPREWNGPAHILPRSALRTTFSLSEHPIPQLAPPGKHVAWLTGEDGQSNRLTVFLKDRTEK